ncbi:AMP-binding protein [Isoptericola jiangsuensis]|uniref:AMP-binding protein n=1 Tax=Isoptericola jiangsuensis TaxID=548579 RepID=UPI003AB08692
MRTSGSTGAPREVALGAAALRASATATGERLGAPGRWVLALPPTHVAGVQVIVRSILAGTRLAAAAPTSPFTPQGLADLLADALRGDDPVHLSLVPTQLHRAVRAADDGAPAALEALRRCGAVLLGGAATPPGLLTRALDAGVPVVRTYGMSETAGGCVYDGVALAGVRLRVAAAPGRPGRVEIAGPTLATGYVGDDGSGDGSPFVDDVDGRWFRTNDLGVLEDGRLRVLGRADDVVVTGGVNVAPAAVEAVVGELLGAEVCVVGVPDDEWGQAVVAVVADPHGNPTGAPTGVPEAQASDDELERVRAEVAARLGPPAAPRRIVRVPALPVRGPGKVDRRAVVDLARGVRR